MNTMLITGATGCIGRAVVAAALLSGRTVRGVARSEPPRWWPAGASYLRADVEDGDAMMRAAEGCDVVIHLAGPAHRPPRTSNAERRIWHATIAGTANAARAAGAAGAEFVLASSVAVYGNPPPSLVDEQTPVEPNTAYGRAKAAAEDACRREHPDPLVLRCAAVFGAGDRGNVVRLMRAIAGRRALVLGTGSNRKSILYSENLADRILACLALRTRGLWCVADAPTPTQRELANAIAHALARPEPPSVPSFIVFAGSAALETLGRSGSAPVRWSRTMRSLISATEVDGSSLDETLSYRPRVSMAEAIRRTVLWLRATSETTARS
jgi:nucleoside-diphosphate-sugar epimerase